MAQDAPAVGGGGVGAGGVMPPMTTWLIRVTARSQRMASSVASGSDAEKPLNAP